MAKAAAVGGNTDPKVAKLSTVPGQMHINVATDLAAQGASVLRLAAQINGLAQSTQ